MNLSLSFATSLNLDFGNLAFLIFIRLFCYTNSFLVCISIFLETLFSCGVAFFLMSFFFFFGGGNCTISCLMSLRLDNH